MLYKPNYCCHCGESIERIDRRFWTSSRFCENCADSFLTVDWLPRIIAGLVVLFGLFGFGGYLKTQDKPINVATNHLLVSSANTNRNLKSESSAANINQSNSLTNQLNQTNSSIQSTNQVSQERTKTNLLESQQNPPSAPVYFCGAQTKKGSPCSRKVKGNGRCWQHIGQPALLPKEKLIVSQ